MKLFSAGLTLVNVATVAGLLLGILGGGLDGGFAGSRSLPRGGRGHFRLGGNGLVLAAQGDRAAAARAALAEIEAGTAPDETGGVTRNGCAAP